MVEDEFKGRNYNYDLRFLDGVNGESLIQNNDEGYYITQGNISSTLRGGSSKEVSIDTNIIAIDNNSKLLELYEDNKNINLKLDEGFIINEVLRTGQGLKVGDEITINIDNKDITGVIQGVNQFLSNNDVYTSEKFLSLKGIEASEINGIFTDKTPSVDNNNLIATVTKLDEFQYSFEKSTEMVKSAGVLQAVIGILLGCLIIGITTNILVQDNRKNLILMRAMGYTNQEINNSCLKIYTPFIILGFLFSIPNSFLIMNLMFNEVAKSASISYPVKFDILSIIISLLVTIVVYYTTIAFYSKRLERVSLNEIMQ